MKIILWLLLSLSAFADFRNSQILYWWPTGNPKGTPGVALTSTMVHGIDHAVGSLTGIQIGDTNGIDASYCTTFVNCPTSIQNCTWAYDHQNIYNDTLLFVTCRPVTNGITYISTNLVNGDALIWYSSARTNWITATVDLVFGDHLETFADTTTAWVGIVLTTAGTVPISGDSGSPVFRTNGDFVGSVAAIGGGGTTIIYFAYPEGSTYRPAEGPSSVNVGVLSGLFNSDPDR